MKKLTIAVDGFSSCGKSTMAKSLAKKLGYTYIDSGAMYRAVSLYCIKNNIINDNIIDETALREQISNIDVEFRKGEDGNPVTYLNGENIESRIRTLEVSNVVSAVSAIPFVREAMVRLQQKAGENGGVIMDGRDIGTVVFPKADLKIFVTADASVRAKRRYDELVEKCQPEPFDEILKNIEMRDMLDQTRAVSPLKQADDAIVLDNGLMTIEQQDKWLMDKVNDVLNGKS
jgi:cytidylate kinase